jgi:hypothetical protein
MVRQVRPPLPESFAAAASPAGQGSVANEKLSSKREAVAGKFFRASCGGLQIICLDSRDTPNKSEARIDEDNKKS